MTDDGTVERRALVRSTLEAARVEVARRLSVHGLPTSVEQEEVRTVKDENGSSWRTENFPVMVSPLRDRAAAEAVRDDAVDGLSYGFRNQLEPLARLLGTPDALGHMSPTFLAKHEEGSENALRGFVAPLAHHYLLQLDDAAIPRQDLVESLADELDRLIDRGTVTEQLQLSIDGVRLPSHLEARRGIEARALTPAELGAFVDARWHVRVTQPRASDYVVPGRFDTFAPSGFISVHSPGDRPLDPVGELSAVDDPQLATLWRDRSLMERRLQRLVLAFFLRGHRVATPGTAVIVTEPRWLMAGYQTTPFSFANGFWHGAASDVNQEEFDAIVDLEAAMPGNDDPQAIRKTIVLDRVLRGCESPSSGFLDLAIALEAALLPDTKVELAYKFRLYGALFLAPERNPSATFGQLKQIYDVRSKIVHGERVSPERLQQATSDARELAIAVTRKSLEEVWPSPSELDARALAGDFGHDEP